MPSATWDVTAPRPAAKPPGRAFAPDCGDYHVDAHGEPYAAVCEDGCELRCHAREQRKYRTASGEWREEVLRAGSEAAQRDVTRAAWLGELYGTGEARTSRERVPKGRISRAQFEPAPTERVRVHLTREEQAQALERFQATRLPRRINRDEWLAEAWVELLNPPANCLTVSSFLERLERADQRARFNIRQAKYDF